MRMHGAAHQTIEKIRSGRFQALFAIPAQCGVRQLLQLMLVRQYLLDQPGDEALPILGGRAPDAAEEPDLGVVVAGGAAFECILPEVLRMDAELRGHVIEYGRGNFTMLDRETVLRLEELQQNGKAETIPSRHVGKEGLFLVRKKPVLFEFLLAPIAFHADLLFVVVL